MSSNHQPESSVNSTGSTNVDSASSTGSTQSSSASGLTANSSHTPVVQEGQWNLQTGGYWYGREEDPDVAAMRASRLPKLEPHKEEEAIPSDDNRAPGRDKGVVQTGGDVPGGLNLWPQDGIREEFPRGSDAS